jgi:Icc-related predicted phosphoesterase
MRIAAMADLHGYLPEIPECDVLVIAGDIFPDLYPVPRRIDAKWAREDPYVQGKFMGEKFVPWLRAAQHRFKYAIGTWGNHDWAGADPAKYLPPFEPLRLLTDKGLKHFDKMFWCTPWTPIFMDWAFMKTDPDLRIAYDKISSSTDVLIAHGPPYGHVDTVLPYATHLGSRELLYAIERVKPSIVICGHIHGGHGYDLRGTTRIYNVSVVDEAYKLVHPATIIDII